MADPAHVCLSKAQRLIARGHAQKRNKLIISPKAHLKSPQKNRPLPKTVFHCLAINTINRLYFISTTTAPGSLATGFRVWR